MEYCADKKSRTKEAEIKVGDTVLVRQPKTNKLSSKFKPHPYQVTTMKGTRVTVNRNGHFITRNVSHFKKLPDNVYDLILFCKEMPTMIYFWMITRLKMLKKDKKDRFKIVVRLERDKEFRDMDTSSTHKERTAFQDRHILSTIIIYIFNIW